MTEVNEPGQEPEMESAGIEAILADDQSAPAEAQAPVQEAAPEAKPEAPEEKPAAEQPFWFRQELKKQKDRAKALERELEQARQGSQRQPEPQFQNVQEYVEYARVMDRLERSEDRFIDKHSDEEFQAVKEWLATRPDIEAVATGERHPWGYAHEQYKVARLREEIGDDPSGWQARKEKEIEERLMAKLAEQGFQASGQAMTNAPRIPAPASGQRSVAPSRTGPAFAGPTPIGDILKR
jgi:hypothetical protein